MNNITKAIIGTTIAIGSIFGGVESSQAREAQCFYDEGFKICYTAHGNNNWTVGFQNNYPTENMNVQCDGKYVDTWRSKGGLDQRQAESLSTYFCSI